MQLIKQGKAYVCDLTAEEISEYRGTLTEPGKDSPYRNRSVEENLDLFARMRAGEFPDGAQRAARQDRHGLAQPEHARPGHVPHPARATTTAPATSGASTRCTTARTAMSDSIEGITHSICTLEFEDHRPLYDWFLEQLGIYHPQQIEFARLNLTYTVMSKRKLLELVQQRHVARLGRPAHADARRPAPARLHARGHPRLLRPHRRGQDATASSTSRCWSTASART